MLRCKLKHVSKRGFRWQVIACICDDLVHLCLYASLGLNISFCVIVTHPNSLLPRYSAAFDVAVETCLSQLHHKQERHAFREVLSMTSSGPKHQIVPESSTSLLLSLNHANEAIRVLAVQHLGTQLAKGQVGGIYTFNSLSPGRCGSNFWLYDFETHLSDWYLDYFLWNCLQVNATELH